MLLRLCKGNWIVIHEQSQPKSCKLFATRKPAYHPTSGQQNDISALTLQRVLCTGALYVHFHFKNILLHSSFARAKTFLFRFVQGFLSVEAKLPFAISRMWCWDTTLASCHRKGRGGRGKSGTEFLGLAPGEPNFPLPQGHCCSSTPGLAGLCTLWPFQGSSQLGFLGSDTGSGVTALLMSHV